MSRNRAMETAQQLGTLGKTFTRMEFLEICAREAYAGTAYNAICEECETSHARLLASFGFLHLQAFAYGQPMPTLQEAEAFAKDLARGF